MSAVHCSGERLTILRKIFLKKRSTFGPSSFKARRCRGLSSFFGLQKHPSVLVLWFGVCLWEKSRYSRLFHRGKSSTSTSSSGQLQLHLNINTNLSVSNMLVYLLLIDSIQFGNFSLCESWNVGTRLWFVWVFFLGKVWESFLTGVSNFLKSQ